MQHIVVHRTLRFPALMLCMFFVGGHGGQIFNCRQWSTTAVFIKRQDVREDCTSKRYTWAPLIILTGPTEPPVMDHIMEPTVDFFYEHDKGVGPYVRMLLYVAASLVLAADLGSG